jgi:hypothetical protein
VVGGSERRIDESGALWAEQSSGVVDPGCGQGFFTPERWKYSRQSSSQHSFSGAGRTAEQNAVAPRRGDEKTSFRSFLTPHLTETGWGLDGRAAGRRGSADQAPATAQVGEDRGEIGGGENL